MELHNLRRILAVYDRHFCSSVKGQFDDVIRGELEDTNPNALKEILEFLQVCQRYGVEDTEYYIELIEEHLKEDEAGTDEFGS